MSCFSLRVQRSSIIACARGECLGMRLLQMYVGLYICYDFYTFVLVSKEHRYGVLIHIYMHYKSICPAMLLIAMYMYMCIYTCMYVYTAVYMHNCEHIRIDMQWNICLGHWWKDWWPQSCGYAVNSTCWGTKETKWTVNSMCWGTKETKWTAIEGNHVEAWYVIIYYLITEFYPALCFCRQSASTRQVNTMHRRTQK